MNEIKSLTEYIGSFQFDWEYLEIKYPKIKTYLDNQLETLNEIQSNLSSINFWCEVQLILGIDSKLMLASELMGAIDNLDLSEDEALEMIEKDYLYYNKEICGYTLDAMTTASIIFKIR